MRKLSLWVVALAAALLTSAVIDGRSQAGVIAPIGLHDAADDLLQTETVQFMWRGHRYCWYNRGWRGAGWYRCGFSGRRGVGWGGPSGWRGWRRPGMRPPIGRPSRPIRPGIPGRPSRPNRPGFQRPVPLPAPVPRA